LLERAVNERAGFIVRLSPNQETAPYRHRLFAVDLDGTLVNRDGSLDPRDVDALKTAIADGITVTIATGRLSSSAVWIARHLGVATPIICADGAALVCMDTGDALEESAIEVAVVEKIVEILRARSLCTYVFVHDGAHGEVFGEAFAAYVMSWTTRLTVHPRLCEAPPFRGKPGVLVALGMGERAKVETARAAIGTVRGHNLEVSTFCLSGADWALRVQPRGSSKGACLARLCGRLGIVREDVAAVGDSYNDLTMFAWAGRSFAMGQAPHVVRAAATDVLSATAETGGGVAEALARWR
jgi:Cof subfamily protein (haloacid dehalogenase superfamily)